MKIENSTIAMASVHQLEDRHTVVEDLRVWVDPPGQSTIRDNVSLSDQGKDLATQGTSSESIYDIEKTIENDPRLFLIKKIIEALTGREIKTLKSSDEEDSAQSAAAEPEIEKAQPSPERTRDGWGVRYEYHETYSERENTTFQAAGIVKTADGQEIRFNIDLQMAREFGQSTDLTFRAGDALIDPLVINFGGKAAELTDQRFAFDLNSDGADEEIPFVTGGSGILVFDRNGDGQANNGSELFGPRTGNGFAELAQLDRSRDGWIDENDVDYANLFLWTKDMNGNNILHGLKESGVGAIYIPSLETSFDLKDTSHNLKGQIERTGVYLGEDGQAGTIQQIDVTVLKKNEPTLHTTRFRRRSRGEVQPLVAPAPLLKLLPRLSLETRKSSHILWSLLLELLSLPAPSL